jgi:hypothetical protein
MTIAILTAVGPWDDSPLVTHSCPAEQLVGERGSLTMWPNSERPIRVPFACIYWLRFRDLSSSVGGGHIDDAIADSAPPLSLDDELRDWPTGDGG